MDFKSIESEMVRNKDGTAKIVKNKNIQPRQADFCRV
jgi:hypothetical protein